MAVDIHPAYLSQLMNQSDPVKSFVDELTTLVNDSSVDMGIVMQKFGRIGIGKLAQLAMQGSNERIQLDAAKTLADRSPETAGIQKIQADGLSLGSQDAQAIAAALVEAAKVSATYDQIGREGLVEVDITEGAPHAMQSLPAPQASTSEGSSEGQGSDNGSSKRNQADVPEPTADEIAAVRSTFGIVK